jgi:hypothetical protein
MNNIGDVYHKKGELDKALEMYNKCWEGRKATLGETHRDTLSTMNNINIVKSKTK